MTYKDMQDEVLGDPFNDAQYRPRIKRYLNDAVNQIVRRLGLTKRYEVAAYTNGLVTLQQAFHEIDEVWESGGPTSTGDPNAVVNQATFRLSPLTAPSSATLGSASGSALFYEAVHAPGTTDGSPTLTLRVWPHQAAGFVGVVGKGRPAEMSADGDFSGLGAELDDTLVAFAKAKCFRHEDDFDMAKQWMGEFEAGVRYASLAVEPRRDGPIILPGYQPGQ